MFMLLHMLTLVFVMQPALCWDPALHFAIGLETSALFIVLQPYTTLLCHHLIKSIAYHVLQARGQLPCHWLVKPLRCIEQQACG